MSARPPWDDEAKDKARQKWQCLSTETVFENPWLRLEASQCIAPTGHECHYGVVRFKNLAVGVVPLFDDGTVALVGQSRFALSAYSWEIPEGGVPFSEDPLEGAKRELREETGFVARHWQEILQLDLSNSVTDEAAICYLAWGLEAHEAKPDETESFEYVRIPFKDLLEAVIKGQVRDALTVASSLRLYHMLRSGTLDAALARVLD